MKRTYDGWLSRDEYGVLFISQCKPDKDGGYLINMGENMELGKSYFTEVTYDNSPVKATFTIEIADSRYKEEYHVDGRLSKVIADLPCIVGTCKGFFNQHYYIFQWQGFTTLVKKGDVIARRENGEWIVRSR